MAMNNYWLTWGPGVLLAILGIVAVIYKVLRILFRIDAALPTLLSIADEFKPNGGNSLKDHLNRIDDGLLEHDRRFDEVEELIRGDGRSTRDQASRISHGGH